MCFCKWRQCAGVVFDDWCYHHSASSPCAWVKANKQTEQTDQHHEYRTVMHTKTKIIRTYKKMCVQGLPLRGKPPFARSSPGFRQLPNQEKVERGGGSILGWDRLLWQRAETLPGLLHHKLWGGGWRRHPQLSFGWVLSLPVNLWGWACHHTVACSEVPSRFKK